MIKIIITMTLLMFFSTSFSQSINNIEDKNGILHITAEQVPLHMRFDGMKDNNQQTIERSQKNGAALQFFLTDNSIVQSGINQDLLVKDVNDFVKNSAKYYKKHPQLKGMQIITFIIYPGYKTPYQLPSSPNNPQKQEFITHFNEMLKNGSTCNKEEFCAINVLLDSIFINVEDSTQKLNNKELAIFLEKEAKNGITLYTSNKNYLQPIKYILVLGTNGYLATEEKIKTILKNNHIQ